MLFLSTIVLLFLLHTQVHFLHEDVIVESIQKAVEERLLSCNASRTYFTQALLPGAAVPVAAGSLQLQEDSGSSGTKKNAVSCEQTHKTDSPTSSPSHPPVVVTPHTWVIHYLYNMRKCDVVATSTVCKSA